MPLFVLFKNKTGCMILIFSIIRFGTRQYFDFIVIIKDDTINDNVVTTGCTLSKQSLCATYSASIAWIVRQEIE